MAIGGTRGAYLLSLGCLGIVYFLILNTNPELVTAAPSSPDFYYYSSGRKNTLPLSKEMLAVRFKRDVSLEKREQIISADDNLASFSERQEVLRLRLTFLPLRKGKTQEESIQTINSLKSKPEVEFVCPIFHFPDTELTVTDEFVVKFKPSATEDEINSFNELHNVEIVRKPEWTKRYTLRVKDPKNSSAIKMANFYYEDPITVFSMPNFMKKLQPMAIPDDPNFPNQWALRNIGQDPPAGTPDADMDAPEGWDIHVGTSDTVIAIIDEGVDLTHEDLANKLVDGYDFVYDDTDPSPWYNDAHGTACAGLAAAETNNGKGVAGVSWRCKIMPIRMASREFYPYFWTTEEWAANAIEWASDNGADVLSNSWGGGPDSDVIHDAIIEAKTNGRDGKGCVIVFSSGNNNGSVSYPAKYPQVIAVGATDHTDERWEGYYYGQVMGSNYGSELDVMAPSGWGEDGEVIFWTTDITGSAGYNSGDTSEGDAAGNYTKWFGGTSGAAPQVAGLAGLILSVDPYLTANEVQEIIEETADDKGDSGWDQYYGWGRINVHSALIEAGVLKVSIDDGIEAGDCVLPDDYIQYIITYSNPVTDPNKPGYVGDANDLVIIDYLPAEGVDFISADPNTGLYDPNERTYTWNIGRLSPGDGELLYLVVQVNQTVEPLSEIVNAAEQICDISHSWATEKTPVCCFGGEVIYVNAGVADSNDGSSWNEAFDRLDDALTAANICDEIWVAKAENAYKPTTNPANRTATFSLLKGVGVFGGFSGDEEERYKRNWFDNETILSGVIDSPYDEPNCVDYVVAIDANNVPSVLDGFTITGGSVAGVYCEKSSPVILHNRITDNMTGIYCFESAQPVIKNNWIYRNSYGLQFDSLFDAGVVRNNTIVNNSKIGIYQEYGVEPAISNCIFSGHPQDSDLVGCYGTHNYIEYPIIQEPNMIPPAIGEGNIHGDPNYPPFVNGQVDDYHLQADSVCIDAGDPNANYDGERDIDKHFRVLDGNGDENKRVDMGADEYCNQGSDNVADFNEDDIVDTADLVEMATAWLTDENDPCWAANYEKYNLYDDDQVIDYIDFAYFAQEWLWMTCEKMQGYEMMEMMMGMGGGMYGMADAESMVISEPAAEQQASEIETQPEPSVAERIEMVKECLEFWYREDVREGIEDKDAWLRVVTSLEEMLKELENSQ